MSDTATSRHPSLFNHNPSQLLLRFALAFAIWLALSVLGYFYGIKLLESFDSYYVGIIEAVHPEYRARIDYDDNATEPALELYVTATRAIEYAPGQALPAGSTVGPTKITVYHTLVPLVIFGVIVLAWPVQSLKEFLLLVALAIPGGLLVTGVTSPFQMLGLLDSAFVNAAAQLGVVYESTALKWMRFTEGGARWLIPILVGILCGRLANRFGRTA